MSIAIEIYDFFSYLIPGTLYIFVFNEFLRVVGWKYINIQNWFQPGQAPDFVMLVPLLVVGYLVGNLLDPISHDLFRKPIYQFRDKRRVYKRVLDDLNNQYPDLKIQFKPKDWDVLFNVIRQRNLEMAHILDKFNASNLMFANVSFGMFLLTIIQVVAFFLERNLVNLYNATGFLVLCSLALYSSNQYRAWFFKGIFVSALEYGKSVKEVVEHKEDAQNKQKGNTRSILGKKVSRSRT